jgi:hypothetical protein
VAGTAASIAALRQEIAAAGGAANVYGFFYEPVQERTGWVLPRDFLDALGGLRDELDLPLGRSSTPPVATAPGSACSRRWPAPRCGPT